MARSCQHSTHVYSLPIKWLRIDGTISVQPVVLAQNHTDSQLTREYLATLSTTLHWRRRLWLTPSWHSQRYRHGRGPARWCIDILDSTRRMLFVGVATGIYPHKPLKAILKIVFFLFSSNYFLFSRRQSVLRSLDHGCYWMLNISNFFAWWGWGRNSRGSSIGENLYPQNKSLATPQKLFMQNAAVSECQGQQWIVSELRPGGADKDCSWFYLCR